MGPLVIKERFKETRVYSCGNTVRHGMAKGMGGRHKSLFAEYTRFVNNNNNTHT